MKKILCPIFSASQAYPQRIALIVGSRSLTYARLEQAVNEACQIFRGYGIKPGAHVVILSPNSEEYIVSLFALWRMGAVSCLLNTREPKNIAHQQILELLNIGQCRVLPLRDSAVLAGAVDGKELPFGSPDQSLFSLARTILFTSGSSGTPKAVVHTIANHYYNALGSNENIPVNPGDRWLLSLPLYHVSGLGILWRSFLGAATVVIANPQKPLGPQITRHKITHISLVTTQLLRLLNRPKTFTGIKAILLGGGPIAQDLISQANDLDLPLYTTYGLTEMSSQVATSQGRGPKPRVLKYRQLKIAASGEILVKGKTLFLGYYQNGKIHKAVDADGWFKTGDMATMDQTQGLQILGRLDRMFISGGENIYPEEIEKAILGTGLVSAVKIRVIKHPVYGQRPIADIVLNKNYNNILVDLKRKLAQNLPTFKIPDQFVIHQHLKTKL